MKKQVRPLTDASVLRQKAEELLKLRTDVAHNVVTKETDLLKLIHELQVHQIELEMQNEELVLAKEKAEQAEEKFTELYDFAPSGYITLSKEGLIAELNFSAARMLGKERLTLVKANFAIFVSAETRPVFNDFFQRVFTGRIIQTCEIVLTAEGNLPIYVSINGIVSHNNEFCLLTLTDITENKKSSIALFEAKEHAEESETRFRNYIQSSPTAVFLVDKNGKYTFVNHSACKLLGYTAKEMQQLSVFDIVKPDIDEKNISFTELKNIGEIRNVEKILYTKDSRAIDVILDAKKLSENEYIGFVKDITERKLAETEVKAARKKAEESETKFRTLSENSPAIIYRILLNPSFKFDYVSPAVTKITGYTPEDHYADPDLGFKLVHPDDRNILEKTKHKTQGEPIVLRWIAKDGKIIWTEQRNVLIFDSAGNPFAIEGIATDITIQKETEEALRQSGEKLRNIYSVAPAGIGVIADRVLREVNPVICEMTGYTREELIEKDARILYPSQQEYEFVGKYKYDKIREKGTCKVETLWQKKDGSIINILLASTPVDKNDISKGTIFTALDITERKRAEAALLESEEKYRVLFSTFPLGITISDSSGNIVESNSRAAELLGITKEEHETRRIDGEQWRIVRTDGTPMPSEEYASAIALKEKRLVENVELGIVKPNEEITWLNVSAAPLHLDNYGAAITYNDITMHRQMENALRENEERLRMALKATNDVVWDWDIVNDTQRWNEAGKEVFGWTEIIEHAVNAEWWLKRIHPDDLKRLEDGFNAALQNNSDNYWQDEYRFLKSDGTYAEVYDRAYLLRDNTGKPIRMIGAMLDITERKQAEQELKRIEWLLTSRPKVSETKEQTYMPPYGDLVALNRRRLILDSVGEQTLTDIVGDYLNLLDTSAAVYEKNGDYAMGIFSSGWCRFMDAASRKACGTDDNRTALDCGKWHCHESCWSRASKTAIDSGQPADIECDGGIRLYAAPIRVGDDIVGVINFGYGDPPREEEKLRELATLYQVDYNELRTFALNYESRPPYIIDLAKNRLLSSARLIGEIIERRQAEDEIKKTGQHYQALIEKAPDGIALIDAEGNFKYISPAAKKMFGYKPTDEVSGNPAEYTHPDDLQMVLSELAKIFENPAYIPTLEYRFIDKSGNWHWVETTFRNLLANPSVESIVLNFRDITERKKSEEKLIKSEERYALVIEASEQGIWDWNVETNEVFYSEQWKKQIGYKDDELKNEFNTWVEHLHPDEREYCRNAVLSYLKQPVEHLILDFRLRHKDGTYRWIHNKAASIKNNDGKVVRLFGTHTDITETKLSEAIFKDIVEKNPMSIQILDMEGYPIQCNSAHTRLFGVEPPSDYSVLKDPQLLSIGFEKSFKRIKKGEVVYFPDSYYNVHDVDPSFPDSPVWVKAVGFTLHDISGKPNKIVLMHENITERKNVEALLNDIIDKNPLSIQVVDKEGHTISGNPAFTELFGSVPPREFSIFEDLKSKSTELGNLVSKVKNGEIVHLPDVYFNAHDAVKEAPDIPLWIRALIFPLNNSSGKPERFVIMHENITERKIAEQELIKAKEKAEEKEAFFRSIFENSPIGKSLSGLDGSLKTNKAFSDMLGYSFDEFQTKNFIEITHPDDLQKTRQAVETLLAGKESVIQFEKKYIHKKGSVIFADVVTTLQKDKNGKPLFFITSINDITDRKAAESELIKAKEHAEESDRLKSAFLANMSHEIRTPMNGILGFSGLLKEPGLTGMQQQEYIRIIEKSGARMLNIINDIVDISKIEAGLMNVNIIETDINEKIEFIYIFFKPQVEGKGMQFLCKKTLPTKEAIIRTDSEKVYSILTNLVKNAIKFSVEGSIEFGYERKENNIEFFVKDTGIGILKERQGAIFERFIQADISDKMARQGAGLGLAISKAYVEMLGGKIWVESKEGLGSTFYFTLPYNTEPDEKEGFEKDATGLHENNQNNPEVSGLKIVIAEDDEISEMLISLDIKEYSSKVIKARTGIEAVEVCRNNPDIDLILMDIQMPDLNGYEAAQQIRQFNKTVVIIAQTAFGLSGDREKAIEAGCNDYIAKPINKNELQALIQKYFKK